MTCKQVWCWTNPQTEKNLWTACSKGTREFDFSRNFDGEAFSPPPRTQLLFCLNSAQITSTSLLHVEFVLPNFCDDRNVMVYEISNNDHTRTKLEARDKHVMS
jgi:hypothetical protein